MALHVGTSGWAYKEWRGSFYPSGLAQKDFLSFYGRELTACEVNATFYRVQPAPVLERWSAGVPVDFRFTVKAHRRITYRRQLAPDAATEAFARDFMESLAPLAGRLGCLLVQVPEFVERDDAGLDALLSLVPSDLPFACEFHHPSWWTADLALALGERGGTICLREEDGDVPDALPPGPLGYLRLKGEQYSDQAREKLRKLLNREAVDRPVYVFARHKGVPADDSHTGLGLARWLMSAPRSASPNPPNTSGSGPARMRRPQSAR